MNRILAAALFVLSTACAPADSEPAPASDGVRCDRLYQLTDHSQAVEPGVLVDAAGDVPAHCRVRGVIERTIRFEVTMPVEGWQGRLMFYAPGGLAGYIGNTTILLDEGFAMATTDTGHEGAEPDFLGNDKARIDYGYRGIHLSTVLAKQVVGTFYGRDVDHAYLTGCSNGGRASLIEAQRYPEDFDGIIAGAPAMAWSETSPWGLAVERWQSENPLTAAALELLDEASTGACDMLDGVADGVIGDPRQCSVDMLNLEALQCDSGETEGCLTEGQIRTAHAIYSGVRDEEGRVLSPGVMPGGEAEDEWLFWVVGTPGAPPATELMGTGNIQNLYDRKPGYQIDQFDLVHGREELARETSPIDVPEGSFEGFRNRGGKLIVYQGWNDFPIRPQSMLDYMARAEELGGSPMDDFARVYMVPGMLHCAGGPGAWVADYVGPMVDWVEEGQAPEEIIGAHTGVSRWFEALAVMGASWTMALPEVGREGDGVRRFTRPICPYPKVAKYEGPGDVRDAESFICTEDQG